MFKILRAIQDRLVHCFFNAGFGLRDIIEILQENFNGPNSDDSLTRAVSNSFWSPLEKNPIAADLGKFRLIFFFLCVFILKMVYCVYSLELPR